MLGGQEGLERLAGTAREHGLGLVVDVVPNHMTVPTYVRSSDLRWRTHAPPTWDTGRTATAEYEDGGSGV